MTTLSTFKSSNSISNLNFYASKQNTGRFVASANDITLVTVVGFNPKMPAFVAPDPNGDPKLFFITNKEGKPADFIL